ncbi:ATP-binding protein [Chlorobium sp. N1]|uniref:sensor histidine kinase n=1 Tax=Chlorobium sp. N1 TaxID=2491138 RepID=UPI00103F7074|nr:ATP-binding protein [Chlorobium sp. N1]TCD47149.1 HAMP domain-containing protein [Chlorobium sp. N1]
MSLRNRIAIYYTAATAVLVALVFTTLYVMIDRVVYSHYDHELASVSQRALRLAYGRPGEHHRDKPSDDDRHDKDDTRRERRREPLRPEFIQLSTTEGTPLRRTANLGLIALPVDTTASRPIFFNTTAGGLELRLLQRPLHASPGQPGGWITVARPLGDAIAVLADLRRVLLLSFPAILITLFALTRAIAARSIRPVEEAISTAESITREHLDRRIPLPSNRDELYRLSATINALLDRLQEAFDREKQFTADASHELKTPLAAVRGTLEVLIRRPREREHYEERIRTCLDELERMTQLIEQLLLLARHDSTREAAALRPIDIDAVIARVLQRLGRHAMEREITIDVAREGGCIGLADPDMLAIMLENLLTNALKYSPRGSTVTLRSGTRDGRPFCTVRDEGEGIEESRLEAVFERFYRIDQSRSSESGGSGLGLAIVRKLGDLQGITVRAEHHEGEGATFRMLFRQG